MFVYKTSPQLVIGLKSQRQIINLINQGNFSKIILICSPNIQNKHIRKIKFHFDECICIETNQKLSNLHIDVKCDLVISYGEREVHELVKQFAFENSIKHYCIETSFAQASSYGINIFDSKNNININNYPNLIFNSCRNINEWNLKDKITSFYDLVIAIITHCNFSNNNVFLEACFFNGFSEFLINYKTLKTLKKKNKIQQTSINLWQSNFLLKNVCNNFILDTKTNAILNSVKNYKQFELIVVLNSSNIVEPYLDNISKTFNNEYDFILLKNIFCEFYNDVVNDIKKQNLIESILDKNLISLVNMEKRV